MTEFKYEIGGLTYIQRPLVLGQIRQLVKAIEGMVIPQGADTSGLIAALGDKLPLALAIVLTPEGLPLKDKDIHAFAGELEFEISPEQTIQAVEDFFVCNPIPSLLEKLSEAVGKISEKMKAIGLKNSSASLPEETSPKETASSGDTA